MTQTKFIKILTLLWLVFSGVYEMNLLDFLPHIKDWVKLIVAVLFIVLNYINGKEVMAKSIGGGGIKNPPPPPKP